MIKYFVDQTGMYLGGFDGSEPPLSSIEVTNPPTHGRDTWNGTAWVAYTPSYTEARAAAYPSIQDQLDMQFHDNANGTTTWADTIAAVKAAHPKPV
tara:strand:+ start:5136 stop:5423 length:288 start_codon:yes stop_codon:yes gene_type:complete